MRVIVGGGGGFIGKFLLQLLNKRGHKVTVISRKPGERRITWDDVSKKGIPNCDAVVNLAGENVLNPLKRWTQQFKQEVISSRIDTTRTLAEAISRSESPPRSWILVTGVGFYPPSRTQQYSEDSPGGDADFLSRLVRDWEAAAELGVTDRDVKTQLVRVRSGVVLGRDGGALSSMLWPFRLCLGGPVGSGKQPFPWIHIEDLCRLLCQVIEQEGRCGGILNAVSPSSITDTNADFTHALSQALRRPAILPAPAFAIQALLGQDRAVMLLEGQRVAPKKTLESGFTFLYPDLSSALSELLS
ncbi:epimerase family protein SDR39U1 isoform X2 [Spea bombifrons]|uniref:epimerase family protein SDR39U1 isoform X2 n=1 Tax=Spea bombifrons TaxID=233779 RepID=UPI00234A3B95|nr:epimerase family protein SDR39U1 isoform X2 [Spea bombifrons]